MTNHTDFARPVDRTLYEAPGRPAPPPAGHPAAVPAGAPVAVAVADITVAPPSLALHARQVAVHQPDAPLREAVPVIDRTLHPSFPASPPVPVPAAAPLPGTVPATTYDPWRPVQYLPTPQSKVAPRATDTPEGRGALDADMTAAQLATVSTSRAKLDRARSYAARLGNHAAEIRAKLSSASERQVAAAIGRAEVDPADVGPLRGELVTVERQHRQALDALADIEAEHARHEADLRALTGSDGEARAKLADAHAARAAAQTAADKVKAVFDRATAHRSAVEGRLAAARAEEARHDADATARLRAALADGDALPTTAEPLVRTSGALEDDLRAATAAVDALKAEHAGKLDALAVAHRAVLAAVDGVLVVDADAIARELHAADACALALRTRLHCFANRRAADYVAPQAKPPIRHPNGMVEPDAAYALALMQGAPPIRQTATIGTVLASAPLPTHQGSASDAWTREADAWTAYAAALAADPQACPIFAAPQTTPPAPMLPASRVA